MTACQKDIKLSEEVHLVNQEDIDLFVQKITVDNFVFHSLQENLISKKQWEEILAKVNAGESLAQALNILANDQLREEALSYFSKTSVLYDGVKEDLRRDPSLLENTFDSKSTATSRGNDCITKCGIKYDTCTRNAGNSAATTFGAIAITGLANAAWTANPVPFGVGIVAGIIGGGLSLASGYTNCNNTNSDCLQFCKS